MQLDVCLGDPVLQLPHYIDDVLMGLHRGVAAAVMECIAGLFRVVAEEGLEVFAGLAEAQWR
jgi:hypothetical protein